MNKELKEVLNVILDVKGLDIVCYDFDTINPFYRYNIICTSTNERQLNAISVHLAEYFRNNKVQYTVEGKNATDWILVDSPEIVVNIFSADTRIEYDLEKLFSYVPTIDVDKLLNV